MNSRKIVFPFIANPRMSLMLLLEFISVKPSTRKARRTEDDKIFIPRTERRYVAIADLPRFKSSFKPIIS